MGFEDGLGVGKNTVNLCLKIKGAEVAVVIQFQSGYPAVVGVAARNARANATHKQQLVSAFGVGVISHRFGPFFHIDVIFCKDAAVLKNAEGQAVRHSLLMATLI